MMTELETIHTGISPNSMLPVPRRREPCDTRSIMDRIVASRELPSLDPPLVPYSFSGAAISSNRFGSLPQSSSSQSPSLACSAERVRGYAGGRSQRVGYCCAEYVCGQDQSEGLAWRNTAGVEQPPLTAYLSSRPPGDDGIRASERSNRCSSFRNKNVPIMTRGDTNIHELVQASDDPPRYSEYPGRGESVGSSETGGGGRKGKGREDDVWQGGDRGGGGKRYDDGGEGKEGGDGDEEEPPRKKVFKKTPIACKFCRGRKLKCDGGRPTCSNCARRSQVCAYDEVPRRRGPGRKNKGLLMTQKPVYPRDHQPEPSSSRTMLARSTTMYQESLLPPPYQTPIPLPRPPIPEYPYVIGRVPPATFRPGAGFGSASAGPSGARGQQSYVGQQQYSLPQYTRESQQREYAQQSRQDEYYQQPITDEQHLPHTQQEQSYRPEYTQTSAAAYSSSMGGISYRGGPSARGGELEYPSEEGEDDGTSGSQSRRRRSSPPEDGPSSYQRKRYDYDRGPNA